MRSLTVVLALAACAAAAHAQTPEPGSAEALLANGVRLHYLDRGPADGEVLVLLHGYSDSSFSFSRLLPLIPGDYRVIAVDLRGHGDSDRPPGRYHMPDLAGDVIGLMDALGIERFIVVGHSMGSFVAQHIAALAPRRAHRLVLIDSAVDGSDLVPLDSLVRGLTEPVSHDFISEFQYSTVHVPLPDEFMTRAIAESGKLPLHVWQSVSAGLIAHETPRGLEAATLLLYGEEDAVFPRRQQDALLARIPGAQLKVYPETGHAPHWERPERVAQDLVAFLRDR